MTHVRAEIQQLATMLALDTERAVDQAAMLHHLGTTAELVEAFGGTPEQINAAWLHEALSVQTPSQALLEEIERRFGAHVVGIIETFAEAPSYPETPRRIKHEEHICKLRGLPDDSPALLVVGADALHQARQLLGALRASGGGRDTRAGREASTSTGFFISVFCLLRDGGLEDLAEALREVGEQIQALMGVRDARWVMANPTQLANKLEAALPDHIVIDRWMGYLTVKTECPHGFHCEVNTSNLCCTTDLRVVLDPDQDAKDVDRPSTRRFLHRARQLTEAELGAWTQRGFHPDTHGDVTRTNRMRLDSANGLVFRRPMSARVADVDELIELCRWLDDVQTVRVL